MGMTRDLWGNIKQTISWQPWGQTKKTQLYKTMLFLQINGLDLAKYHKVAHRWKAGKLDETDGLCLDWGGGDGTVSTSLELLNSAKPGHLLCRQHEGHTHTHTEWAAQALRPAAACALYLLVDVLLELERVTGVLHGAVLQLSETKESE